MYLFATSVYFNKFSSEETVSYFWQLADNTSISKCSFWCMDFIAFGTVFCSYICQIRSMV